MSLIGKSPYRQDGGNGLLASLKCWQCRTGYAKPPIYPCKKNHLLCPTCKGNQRLCFCGKKFQKSRFLVLEALAQDLLKPCPWRCEKWLPPDEMEVHEKHCDLKKLFCVSVLGYGHCNWAGTRKHLTKHFLGNHSDISTDDFLYDFVITNYSKVEKFSATRLLKCFSHMFMAKLVYDDEKRIFYGGVHFVSGPPSFEKVFRYEFEIGKQTGKNAAHCKIMFSRQAHRISEDYSDHTDLNKCDHFCFPKDMGNFFTDIDDSLTVTVIMKSVQSLAMSNIEALKTYSFVPSQYCQQCVKSFNPVPPI